MDKFYQQYKHRMVNRPEAELKQSREILKKYRLPNERQEVHTVAESWREDFHVPRLTASRRRVESAQDDVEALKEKQTSIQRDLQEIKGLTPADLVDLRLELWA